MADGVQGSVTEREGKNNFDDHTISAIIKVPIWYNRKNKSYYREENGLLEVAICDDDKEDLDKAALMLDKILSEYQVQYQIRSFLSANELLNNNDKIDIGILDISMEELGGITLGKLKEKIMI